MVSRFPVLALEQTCRIRMFRWSLACAILGLLGDSWQSWLWYGLHVARARHSSGTFWGGRYTAISPASLPFYSLPPSLSLIPSLTFCHAPSLTHSLPLSRYGCDTTLWVWVLDQTHPQGSTFLRFQSTQTQTASGGEP